MGTKSRENIKEYLRILLISRRSSEVRGSPGESIYENLELELTKPFNPNRREIRVPEYSRGVKDPNTTQWRRGPVRHTAKLVKVFAMSRLDFGQGVWKGGLLQAVGSDTNL